jgi:hypothetical protein
MSWLRCIKLSRRDDLDPIKTIKMAVKKQYSQAARVQGILRTLAARQGITIKEEGRGRGRKEEGDVVQNIHIYLYNELGS